MHDLDRVALESSAEWNKESCPATGNDTLKDCSTSELMRSSISSLAT